jgi:hypothetical protein
MLHPNELCCTPLSYAATYWATLTLLSYAAPSELNCTLLSCAVPLGPYWKCLDDFRIKFPRNFAFLRWKRVFLSQPYSTCIDQRIMWIFLKNTHNVDPHANLQYVEYLLHILQFYFLEGEETSESTGSLTANVSGSKTKSNVVPFYNIFFPCFPFFCGGGGRGGSVIKY